MASRPVTRAKNVNQRPGQIILDMRQKHRTPEQRHQDNARIEQEKNEQEAAQARAVKRVADTIISETEAEKNRLTKRTHPRPHSAPSQARTSTTKGM